MPRTVPLVIRQQIDTIDSAIIALTLARDGFKARHGLTPMSNWSWAMATELAQLTDTINRTELIDIAQAAAR